MFPRLGHVFDSQFAFVVHKRELQAVFVGARELINARTLAAFWFYASSSLECHLIAGDGPCAPRVAFAVMLKIDIEGTIGLDRPDRAERICPSAHESGLPRSRINGARAERGHDHAGKKNSKSWL